MNLPNGYSHIVVAESPMYCCLACSSVVHTGVTRVVEQAGGIALVLPNGRNTHR